MRVSCREAAPISTVAFNDDGVYWESRASMMQDEAVFWKTSYAQLSATLPLAHPRQGGSNELPLSATETIDLEWRFRLEREASKRIARIQHECTERVYQVELAANVAAIEIREELTAIITDQRHSYLKNHKALVAAVESDRCQWEHQRKDLKQSISTRKQQLKRTEKELEELRKRVAWLESENGALRRDMESASRDIDNLRSVVLRMHHLAGENMNLQYAVKSYRDKFKAEQQKVNVSRSIINFLRAEANQSAIDMVKRHKE